MRPLTRTNRDDRGAVLLWVAIMLTALLGAGAIVIDAGALYAEKRQLQNGADAAALAVAADCAQGDCQLPAGRADTYADANANDDAADVAPPTPCGNGPGLSLAGCEVPDGAADASGWVRVTTSTDNPANAGDASQVDFLLAPVLDVTNIGRTVRASAVAAWGPIGGASTFPFTFSVCEFEHFGGSIAGGSVPTGSKFVYSHKTPPTVADWECEINPNSGSDYPGGFGWLDNEDCVATVENGWVGGDTGNPLQGCDAADLQDLQGQTIVIPLYDQTSGTGSNAEFHIVGFAGFTVLGYKLVGYEWGNTSSPWEKQGSNFVCPLTTGSSGTCLYGEFTEVTTNSGQIGGGSTDFGANAVEMID